MKFTHVHTSSFYGSTVGELEKDLDRFMKVSEIITMTEIGEPRRYASTAERGWAHYKYSVAGGRGDVAVLWDTGKFAKVWSSGKKLCNRWPNKRGGWMLGIVCTTVILKERNSGHKILVTVVHLPNGVEGRSTNGYGSTLKRLAERKRAYNIAINAWETHTVNVMRAQKPDIVLMAADFNLNVKKKWVRDKLAGDLKRVGVRLDWKKFPTMGTHGHGRLIDATYSRGVKTPGSIVMGDIRSSDHHPYKTTYENVAKPRTPLKPSTGGQAPDDSSGDNDHPGEPWWGFGDYDDDEMFHIEVIAKV